MGVCATSAYDVEVEENLHIKAGLHNSLPCPNQEVKREREVNQEPPQNEPNPEESEAVIDSINQVASVSPVEQEDAEYS